jgi:ABC-type uncharacterized transport system substrate-binding protein
LIKRPWFLSLLSCVSGWGALLGFSQPVFAHPHIFVDYRLSIRHSASAVQGFEMLWRLDAINSQLLLDEFDKNRNHRLEPQEANAAAANMADNMAEFQFFSEVIYQGKRQALKQVKEIQVSLVKGHIYYRLFLPCILPLTKSPQSLSFRAFDSSNFVAFMPLGPQVQLKGKAPIRWQITRQPKQLNQAWLLSLAQK